MSQKKANAELVGRQDDGFFFLASEHSHLHFDGSGCVFDYPLKVVEIIYRFAVDAQDNVVGEEEIAYRTSQRVDGDDIDSAQLIHAGGRLLTRCVEAFEHCAAPCQGPVGVVTTGNYRHRHDGCFGQFSEGRRQDSEVCHREIAEAAFCYGLRVVRQAEISVLRVFEAQRCDDGVGVCSPLAGSLEGEAVGKDIVVDHLSPAVHLDRFVVGHYDVARKDVATLLKPKVGVQRVVDDYVVFDRAVEPLAQFDASVEAQVVVDMVVCGTVVEVDVPATVAADAVVAYDDGCHHVGQDQSRIVAGDLRHGSVVGVPVAVASPRVD